MAFLGGVDLIPDIVALAGVLVFCSGLHLLWQSRRDISYWVEEYFRLLRMNVRQVVDPTHAPLEFIARDPQKRHTLRIALGIVLAFFVAPVLITLGWAF